MSPMAFMFCGRTASHTSLASLPGSVASDATSETMLLRLKPMTISLGRDLRVGGGGNARAGRSGRGLLVSERLADLAAHEEQLWLVGLVGETLVELRQGLDQPAEAAQGGGVERIGPPVPMVGGDEAAAKHLDFGIAPDLVELVGERHDGVERLVRDAEDRLHGRLFEKLACVRRELRIELGVHCAPPFLVSEVG